MRAAVVAAVWLIGATPTLAAHGNCLEPPPPADGRDANAYDVATHRSLIGRPSFELAFIVQPSFRVEYAVHITSLSPEERAEPSSKASQQVVSSRARRPIWPLPTRGPEAFAFRLLPEEVDTASAPISRASVAALAETWEEALHAFCPVPANADEVEIVVDGVTFKFERPVRGALVRSPDQGTIGAALVALGEQLVAFPRAPAKERAAHEASLVREAKALAARLRQRRKAPPTKCD